ncbi:MAG: hypothetical protein KR126chlam2_00522, partial [Chlamydiae bacterium]|nr:hypothetical protein [Chlamydiota bacterium]
NNRAPTRGGNTNIVNLLLTSVAYAEGSRLLHNQIMEVVSLLVCQPLGAVYS